MPRPLVQSTTLLGDVGVAIIVLGLNAAPSVGEQLGPGFQIHSEGGEMRFARASQVAEDEPWDRIFNTAPSVFSSEPRPNLSDDFRYGGWMQRLLAPGYERPRRLSILNAQWFENSQSHVGKWQQVISYNTAASLGVPEQYRRVRKVISWPCRTEQLHCALAPQAEIKSYERPRHDIHLIEPMPEAPEFIGG